jgi:hypothetical protein
MQALDRFTLIVGVLRRKAEEMRNTGDLEIAGMVAERAGLRRAAACTWNRVPTIGRILPRSTCPRKDVNDRAAPESREIDLRTAGGRERKGGSLAPVK